MHEPKALMNSSIYLLACTSVGMESMGRGGEAYKSLSIPSMLSCPLSAMSCLILMDHADGISLS